MKNATHRLRRETSLLIMNTELENQHSEKDKLRKEINKICIELKSNLSRIVLSTSSNTCCRLKQTEEHE